MPAYQRVPSGMAHLIGMAPNSGSSSCLTVKKQNAERRRKEHA
jgi:hypothetical protein